MTRLRVFTYIIAIFGCLSYPATARAAPQAAEINGAQISYETCGVGAHAVVLVHDGLAASSVYDDVWPALCKRYHVIRYDRRGYGRSAASSAKYAPADDLKALLAHLGLSKADFIGASAGGGVVVELALQSPESVNKLVLIGAAIPGYPVSKEFIARLKDFIAAMQQGDADAATAAILASPHMIAPGNTVAREKLAAIRKADPNIHNPAAGGAQIRNADAMKRIGEVRAPTLILIGEADDPQNIAQAEALKMGLPNATLVAVPRAGHLLYLEQTDTFLRLVTQFLE